MNPRISLSPLGPLGLLSEEVLLRQLLLHLFIEGIELLFLLVFPPADHRVVAFPFQLHLAHEFVYASCLLEAGLAFHGVVNCADGRVFWTVLDVVGLNLRGQFAFRFTLDDDGRAHFEELIHLAQVVILRHGIILIQKGSIQRCELIQDILLVTIKIVNIFLDFVEQIELQVFVFNDVLAC